MSHPYQASVKSNAELQQGLFPSWHDRRHSHTSEQILEAGRRKSGSFEALQKVVKQKQSEEDEKRKKSVQEQVEDQDISNKITSIVKDTTSGPAIITNELEGNNSTPLKKRPSVRFKEDSNFIKN
jgi:hypothetical protein